MVHEDLDVRKAAMNASVRNDPLSEPLCVADYVLHSPCDALDRDAVRGGRCRSGRIGDRGVLHPRCRVSGAHPARPPRARRSRRGGGAARQLVRRLDGASPRRVEDRGSQRPAPHRVQVRRRRRQRAIRRRAAPLLRACRRRHRPRASALLRLSTSRPSLSTRACASVRECRMRAASATANYRAVDRSGRRGVRLS